MKLKDALRSTIKIVVSAQKRIKEYLAIKVLRSSILQNLFLREFKFFITEQRYK
jgi:hypothetical protein